MSVTVDRRPVHHDPGQADREVAQAVLGYARTVRTPEGLRLTVVGARTDDPVVCMEERERFVRVHAHDLRSWIEERCIAPDQDMLSRMVGRWVGCRPACDDEALRTGTATVGLSSVGPGWEVTIDRSGSSVTWRPSVGASPEMIAVVRAGSAGRATGVRADMWAGQGVALWRCADQPAFTSAVLVNPERMLAQMARKGLPTRDLHVIVGSRVQGAVAAGAPDRARRLAAGLPDAHAVVPLCTVEHLGWL